MYVVCVLVFIIMYVERARTVDFNVDPSNLRPKENHRVLNFHNATGHKAVVVEQGMPLSINFCLRKRCAVTIENIRFLNLNSSAIIEVHVNRLPYGSYVSKPNLNHSSIFMNTGNFSIIHDLEGWNIMKLYINSTVAVDTITVRVDDDKINSLIFTCNVTCIKEARFPTNISKEILPGYMTQNSFSTDCAEVDNIDVPIYHSTVSKFNVTATLPQYRSFVNTRHENLTDCPHLPPTLWHFDDFEASPSAPELSKDQTFLTFKKERNDLLSIIITFRLQGHSSGSIDSDMGSLLFLNFTSLSFDVTVSPRIKQRKGTMEKYKTVSLNESELGTIWKIRDYTWKEREFNYIAIDISSKHGLNFDIDIVKLDRRPFLPDKTVTLYKSDDAIIEGILVDMWWRARERMTIKINDIHSFDGYAFLRIYRPVPWTIGYSQVFILYQDGNARFLPISPNGLDWIPFGTSVIIGQVQRDSTRPYVSISEVMIYPEESWLKIQYLDGSSMKMTLEVTEHYTRGVFEDLVFLKNKYIYPFITARSMYVDEGNTDVDSVKVDNVKTFSAMDNWGMIEGRSFAFHRRCMSVHLNLSPDIHISIIDTFKGGSTCVLLNYWLLYFCWTLILIFNRRSN